MGGTASDGNIGCESMMDSRGETRDSMESTREEQEEKSEERISQSS